MTPDRLCKATIQVGDTKITYEGPREFVEGLVNEYVLKASKQHPKQEGSDSLADLVGSKQPHGHAEIVAVLSFWITEAGKVEFTEHDLRDAYIQAGLRPPKVVAQALRDAKKRYDYIALGSERGSYRLSPHGD